ncbi:hypothetical protein MCANUFG1_02201 [Mycoplasmopsis canis UFG1]|uniref:hypothetical protein n=1 Tax=Mycoplasmopsis canis TaxID=29555 RepID=UPI00025B0134|nr:hypothetical protein [Mycoplasmopsis canis]EIE41648.1 hypothetical protein MCANUFG1_02201 [Mycoplasmopsis canis UFG1]
MSTLSENDIKEIKNAIKEFQALYSSLETRIYKEIYRSKMRESENKINNYINESEKALSSATKIVDNANIRLSSYFKNDSDNSISKKLDNTINKEADEYEKEINRLFSSYPKIESDLDQEFLTFNAQTFNEHKINFDPNKFINNKKAGE